MGTSVEPFRRLVKLVARAFYDDDITQKGQNKVKSDRSDNRGIAVVVLDALTRRQWVKEDDLAKDLRLHPKQLRRTLRFLEDEALVMREHRRETIKGVKAYNAAIAATSDGLKSQREDKQKAHTHSYCCMDYAQVFDIIRYKIHRAKKKIKDELEDRNTIQHYLCPNASCGRRYSALDAARLISFQDDNFHCENCNGELVAESDKLAAEELGDGEDNARRRRREKLKDLYERMEKQLKPVMDYLGKVKDLTPPDYGSLVAWEARAIAAGRSFGSGEVAPNMPKTSQQNSMGTPLPDLGDTKVEVSLAGSDVKEEESKDDVATLKVLPPWMIREGMNLSAQQRGEVKQEVKSEDGKMFGVPGGALDTKPSEDDKEAVQRKLQEEYLKAYYAALMQRQQESSLIGGEATTMTTEPDSATEMQVDGAKVKREEGAEEEAEAEVEWEEEATAHTDFPLEDVAPENIVSNASNNDSDPGNEDCDDGIDWEDG